MSPPIEKIRSPVANASKKMFNQKISAITKRHEARVSIELGAFREALQHLGSSDGRTVRIDYRDAQEDLQAAAIRLLGVHPDATVAVGVEALKALQKQTQSVPIVFTVVSDPISSGFVPSLARPGGNVTGFMNFEYSIVGKWLSLLKQIAPVVSHAKVIDAPGKATWTGYEREINAAGHSLAIPISYARAVRAITFARSIALDSVTRPFLRSAP